ncbi:MAG: hypothetical protein PWP23_522 [Candidatus Sumerlaeota bacterium]|nr:hypothetical protein [Candidatus Sumerlaeota bacterium]
MKLYGRTWTRREIEARVGLVEQIGGLRRYRLTDGSEDGVEQVHVRTGAGLEYSVAPQRGLDVSLAAFAGTPLSWQSPNRLCHPSYFRPEGTEWLRTAAGGLLMTCGMRQVGSPCEDNGEELGIHGRLHHTPAHEVAATSGWEGDEFEMRVSGTLHEARIFGENLVLHRSIRSRLGENRLCIHDRVENIGFLASPLMMLYHFNFGFPLVQPGVKLAFPSKTVVPREEATPLDGHDRWDDPDPHYRERVYYHTDLATAKDARTGREMAEAVIENPAFPVGDEVRPLRVRLRWDTATLPNLVQWKNPGAGTHVLGIEPANCLVGGRACERERGSLVHIEPGGSQEFFLEMVVD